MPLKSCFPQAGLRSPCGRHTSFRVPGCISHVLPSAGKEHLPQGGSSDPWNHRALTCPRVPRACTFASRTGARGSKLPSLLLHRFLGCLSHASLAGIADCDIPFPSSSGPSVSGPGGSARWMRRGQTEERRARSKDTHLSRESASLRVLWGDDSTNRGPALRGRMSERDGLIPLESARALSRHKQVPRPSSMLAFRGSRAASTCAPRKDEKGGRERECVRLVSPHRLRSGS